jgi:hypothetical protein
LLTIRNIKLHTTPDSITINHYLRMIKEGLNIVLWSKLSRIHQKERKVHFVGGVLLIYLMIIWIIIPLCRIQRC